MRWLENRIPPLAMVLLFALAMASCAGLFGVLSIHLTGQRTLAWALFLGGVAVMAVAAIQFGLAKTTVDPLHPAKASALVRSGIFRVSRNPMYLGMALVLLAWAVFLGNALALLLVAGFVGWINHFQIAPEERALSAHFGAEFADYCQQTRRWI